MRARGKRSRGGFTLIELLLVISIILVLITILVVAVKPASEGPAACQKRMDSLSAALEAYRSVFGFYPPSNNASVGKGAQCLYYYLKGPQGTGWSVNSSPAVAAEYTWQGAMNVSADWSSTPQGSTYTSTPYFNDAIQGVDRAILYYRAAWRLNNDPSGVMLATSTNSIGLDHYYNYNDNLDSSASANGSSPFWPGQGTDPTGASKQQQWYNEITDWNKTNASSTNWPPSTSVPVGNRYPQRPMTYILISAGIDREFGVPSDPNVGWKSDDIVNY